MSAGLKPYDDLTRRGRSRRLRRLAEAALRRYDLPSPRLRLLANESNGIFRIDASDGRRYIMRVATPRGGHDLADIRSELMWLTALNRDTDLRVSEPVPASDGAFVVTAEADGVPEPRHCTVFRWIPGNDLAASIHRENMRKLGALMARLHAHGASFRPPEGFRLRRYDKVFPYADPSFPLIEPVALFDDANAHLMANGVAETYRRAIDVIQESLDRLYAPGEPPAVIHNDLHQWNIKVHEGELHAFDFEDLLLGYPVQDIATTLYYFQRRPDYPGLREAYRAGYTATAQWPPEWDRLIEVLMAARGVFLVNWVVVSNEREDLELAREYVPRVAGRLRELLGIA